MAGISIPEKKANPQSFSALNPKPFDPTSIEATNYQAMLDDITKLRRETDTFVDRIANLKGSIDLLASHLGKVSPWKR